MIVYKTYDSLNECSNKVVAFALMGYAETIKGLPESSSVMPELDTPAIVAYSDTTRETPIGILCYFEMEDKPSYWIALSYVDPKWRKQGIWTTLWERLVSTAAKNKIRYVESGIAYENKAMQAAAKSVGRVPTAITYSYEVLPHKEKR